MSLLFHRFFRRKNDSESLVYTLALDIAAVMVWRGTWGFMDLYIFPNNTQLSLVFSLIAGLALLTALKITNK